MLAAAKIRFKESVASVRCNLIDICGCTTRILSTSAALISRISVSSSSATTSADAPPFPGGYRNQLVPRHDKLHSNGLLMIFHRY